MNNRINTQKSIVMVVVAMAVFAFAMAGIASAKSMYVISDLNANPPELQSYDITGSTLVWQTTNTILNHGYGPVGLTIDTDSAMLFVTYENSNTIELVDATTMASEGFTTAPGASNLAGVVVDQDKQKVYTMDRRTKKLYVYSWDAVAKTLTLDNIYNLANCYLAYGIALDEVNDLLYVADRDTSVEYYNTADWSHAGSLAVSHSATGIAIDVTKQCIYTGAGSPSGATTLSKYDLITGSESTVNVGSSVLGVAVDPDTGLVYVTTYSNGPPASKDRLMVYDSSLTRTWVSGDIGNPTGVCIPGKEISYNPLNLAKDDGVSICVNPGAAITYTISYTNNNNYDVTSVTIVDTLPSEVTYQSCTNSGVYDGANGTVTWNIGTVTAGSTGSVMLTVLVDASTPNGTTITNPAKIDSDLTPQTTVNEQTLVCTGGEIPEFPTVMIPAAMVIGMAFLMFRRKRD